jgi:glutathione S-transferase
VPALELDDGQVLTEGPAIVQYLADLNPESALAPPNGSALRYRLQEMLSYVTSEIHKTYSPLFNPKVTADVRAERIEYLKKRYAFLDRHLAVHDYLVGDRFTAADAYLFVVTNWARSTKVDLSEFAHLTAFQQRIAARPAVLAAMKAEGLISADKAA